MHSCTLYRSAAPEHLPHLPLTHLALSMDTYTRSPVNDRNETRPPHTSDVSLLSVTTHSGTGGLARPDFDELQRMLEYFDFAAFPGDYSSSADELPASRPLFGTNGMLTQDDLGK